MRVVVGLFVMLVLAAGIAYAADDNAANPQERNCKDALLKMQIFDAMDCYKGLGDQTMRDATNALILKKYDDAISIGKDATKYQSGFGFCFMQHGCGGAAHTASIVAVAADKSGNSGLADSWTKKAFNYAKNSGQCYGSDVKANNLCAYLYILSEFSSLGKASKSGTYQEDDKCKLVAGTGQINNLNILYMGSDFANLATFDDYVKNSASTLLGFKPFDAFKNKINIWKLEDRTNFDCVTQEPRLFSCNSAKIAEKRVLCPNDQVIIVVKSDQWRGFGAKGGSVSGTSSWSGMPYTVVLHEFGHSFGSLDDEYVYGAGDGYAPNPNSLNCDAAACPKFVAASVNNCLQGCGFNTQYRSIDNGMMRELGQPFGAFDEKILSEKLANYGK